MFRIKYSTKRIFRIVLNSKIKEMMPFCKLIYGTTLVLGQLWGTSFEKMGKNLRVTCQIWAIP